MAAALRAPNSEVVRVTILMSCLFAVYGVALPYLSRWLEVERGLVGAEIGAVLSLAQLARIATGPTIAFWADGAGDRRTPIRVLTLVGLVSYAGFFFLAHDVVSLIAFGFVALTASQGLSPFVEGAVLRATDKWRFPYGLTRGIGSAVFIVANVCGGLLIARFGLGAVMVWILAGMSFLSLSAWAGLRHDPPPSAGQPRSVQERLQMASSLLRTPRFLFLILSCGIIQAGHGFFYGFSTLVWRAQEISPGVVGWLWGFGVAAEVVFLWSLPAIEKRISSETLIIIGGVGAAIRWLAMGFAPTGFVLWPIMALHALSFAATHVGAMRLLFREAPEHSAGLAQTMYSALASGLFMGVSTLFSGALYDAVGARGYWAMAVLVLVGAALALPLLAPPKRGVAVPHPGEPRP